MKKKHLDGLGGELRKDLHLKKSFVELKIRPTLVSSLASFVIGFLVAWLIWAQTASYMFAVMRP